MTKAAGELWAIVLAGGEGRRLAALTTALHGEAVPKQYAVFDGSRSPLQHTLDRVVAVVPAERTLLVIARGHERWALPQTAAWPGLTVLVEPRSYDSGPGVLLAVAHVLARDPAARVVVFPSDGHVDRPDRLIAAVRAAAALHDSIALLGVPAVAPATDYGWIVPGAPLGPGGARRVRRFVEKPSSRQAERLLAKGGYWSTFIFSAPAQRLWLAARRTMPRQTAVLEVYAETIGSSSESVAREIAFSWMEPASFNDAVLQHTPNLVLVPVEDCGWSDLGTPERVYAALGPQALRKGAPGAHDLRSNH